MDPPTSGADKQKVFENEGVVFKAKLIGSELVMEPRGDKMCQNSIQRLKAIIKGTNSHKKRIVLKISYDGVKVYDEKTNEILHHHEVSQISYIAKDDTDNRSFGYVSDVPNKAHQFICFKTSGPAINVMSVISDLFAASLEKKNKEQAEKEKEKEKEKEDEIIIKHDQEESIIATKEIETQPLESASLLNIFESSSFGSAHKAPLVPLMSSNSNLSSGPKMTSTHINAFAGFEAFDSNHNSQIIAANNALSQSFNLGYLHQPAAQSSSFGGSVTGVNKNNSIINQNLIKSSSSAGIRSTNTTTTNFDTTNVIRHQANPFDDDFFA